MKVKYTIRLFATLLLTLCFNATFAAHLIGGEISYQCTGANVYDIKLRIYRDCGGGGAQFDNPAAVAVYDINNNLITTLSAPLGPVIRVSTSFTGNPCASAPASLCSEYTEYLYSGVSLPPIAGGYTLVHQRCCRNNSVSNITNSGNFGNTYSVTIPSNDVSCNSSPQILGVPPVTLCLGIPSTIPINATDPDGDSLFFEFCDIFTGGGRGGGGGGVGGCNSTTPNPPCPPPFTPISFLAPFTSSNPLPGNFTLDPQTGTLTGTADQLGQYAVGICVSEYRNGMFLSQVRLDFQFNFANCVSVVRTDVVSQFDDPTIGCDGFTIDFTNRSSGATGYLWDFGDPTSTTDTSTKFEPSYTYPGPGDYTVTLIGEPGAACADTVTTTFTIKRPIDPSFHIAGVQCLEGLNLSFVPTGFYPPDAQFEWFFGTDASPAGSSDKFVNGVSYETPGKHYIELTVKANGCEYSTIDSIVAEPNSVSINAGPDTTIDRDVLLRLQGTGADSYYWSSSEAVKYSSQVTASTTVEFIPNNRDTVELYLLGTDQNGCQGLDTVLVFLNPSPNNNIVNLFTPNGDGLNETFDLTDLNPNQDCELTVLNRWGSEVFYARNYDNAWTGTDLDGGQLQDGTYYYILRCDGEIVQKNAVTIIRSRQ